ncbi:hypothetical protein BD414DRAFT_538441 [Trametes punicea]|nr:hypothetical protein BD414DRAFT_538441 [Trametes punicea]
MLAAGLLITLLSFFPLTLLAIPVPVPNEGSIDHRAHEVRGQYDHPSLVPPHDTHVITLRAVAAKATLDDGVPAAQSVDSADSAVGQSLSGTEGGAAPSQGSPSRGEGGVVLGSGTAGGSVTVSSAGGLAVGSSASVEGGNGPANGGTANTSNSGTALGEAGTTVSGTGSISNGGNVMGATDRGGSLTGAGFGAGVGGGVVGSGSVSGGDGNLATGKQV